MHQNCFFLIERLIVYGLHGYENMMGSQIYKWIDIDPLNKRKKFEQFYF